MKTGIAALHEVDWNCPTIVLDLVAWASPTWASVKTLFCIPKTEAELATHKEKKLYDISRN